MKLASRVSTESPSAAPDSRQALTRTNRLMERRNWIDDATQTAQLAAALHSLADRADKAVDAEPVEIDRGEILASAVSDAAAEYSERLTRIQDFVFGFKNVPHAEQWWQSIGVPIVKMAAGEKL
ncbi:hypothetical protein CH302_00925 [Rhodococcus sp. 15-2388-1-1a]|nr:hypothetical protein CH302_00925 [Rhodococcus sp. 15-2388-1-1a]